MSYLDEIVLGTDLPAALAAECEVEPPDAIVVDYLMRSTLCRAEALGIPWFTLVHTTYRFFGPLIGDGEEEWGWRWQYRRVNEIRRRLGLAPLPIGPESLGLTTMRRATGALVAMPPEFDEWEVEAPPNLVHTGPIFEEPPGAVAWDSPWPGEDRRPLVVVSFGSTYMHQEELLGRVASAVSDLDVRALVLTGPELDPGELDLPSSVRTMAFVPHSALLPEAALVVSHGGIGTLMAAFAAGVPTLCIPLGRDQDGNAERLAELEAGAVLSREAGVEEIREACAAAMSSPQIRAGAAAMAAAIGGRDGATTAAEAVERLAG
jgi:UDP:flavonoid glycosyltransferase YjiC (YdhE family)